MATRDYRRDGIVVHWNPERCIHSGNCVRALPAAFDPAARPWVQVDAADVDDLAAAVDRCPSGALSATRLDADGAPLTVPGAPAGGTPVRISVLPDGPVVVDGPVEVVDERGGVVRTAARVALCRCGQSAAKPYCDASHRAAGFSAPGIPAPGPSAGPGA